MRRHETPEEKRTRIARGRRILRRLEQLIPDAGMELRFGNNWELLVAVELSAQCTDKRVNMVTPALFARYPTLDDYVTALPAEFEQLIFSTGFYHNKTKNILAAARVMRDEFHGVVPKTMEEMLRMPGVARKTANVVLGNAYGIVEGIAVDTHVKRFARLFGLSDEENPDHIERDLMEVFSRSTWFHSTYLLIEYGRRYCPARHTHEDCPLRNFITRES
jgi:endonuclease III